MSHVCARVCGVLVLCMSGPLLATGQVPSGLPPVAGVQAPDARVPDLVRVAADEVFASVLDRMWQTSPTFRHQCRRLRAGAPGLRLHLGLYAVASGSVRARSVVQWRGGVLASASLFVPNGPETEELIAHELEHVLEQVDHVDLASHVASGVAWRHGRDGYETARAIAAGRKVASEVAASRVRAGPP